MKQKSFFLTFVLISLFSRISAQESPTEPLKIEDGICQIFSAEDFRQFAQAVNSGQVGLDAVLKTDIEYTDKEMPGTEQRPYEGTFDGQFHVLTIQRETDHNGNALFGYLKGEVKNLTVAGNIQTSHQMAAGICVRLLGGSIRNCVSAIHIATSLSGDGTHAGLCAVSEGGEIRNCTFSGTVSGQSTFACGGIISWASSPTRVQNCLVIGDMDINKNDTWVISRNPGNVVGSDNYYLHEFGSVNESAQLLDENQLRNGYACFHLNGSQSKVQWTQTLGTDPFPVPVPSGMQVYPVGHMNCAGICTEDTEETFSNTENTDRDPHTFQNGICTVCGNCQTDYAPMQDDFYLLSKPEDLIWFATMVNRGDTRINGLLQGDLDLTGIDFPTIGSNVAYYGGVFDGGMHTIRMDVVPTEDGWGLFRKLEGTVRSLILEGSLTAQDTKIHGSIAGDLCGGVIENCISRVHLSSTFNGDAALGGICSRSMANGGKILNCIFDGSITGSGLTNCGGLIGWANNQVTIANCLQIGTIDIVPGQDTYVISRNPGQVNSQNNYYLHPFGNINPGATQISEEQLLSGELCYWLNEDGQSLTWRQTLGEDATPLPNGSGLVVYGMHGVYSNVVGEADFALFRNNVYEHERQYLDNIRTQKVLADQYREEIDLLNTDPELEKMLSHQTVLDSLRALMDASALAYNEYEHKVNEVLAELKDNTSLSNVKRDELETYLQEFVEPNDLYSNGSAPYILESLLLDNETLKAEAEKIDQMLTEALNYDPAVGTILTQLLVNPTFEKGNEGWEGDELSRYGKTETSTIFAAELRGGQKELHQTLTGLRNGVYEVRMNGAFRPWPESNARNTNYGAMLYANGNQNYFQTNIEDMIPVSEAVDGENCRLTGNGADIAIQDVFGDVEGYTLNSIESCSNAFQSGRYTNAILTNVTDGTLTIGVKMPGTNGQNDWLGFGNVQVIYYGTLDDATQALDEVLAFQSARATTILESYEFSSGEDYADYPNFSQEIKDQLDEYVEEVASLPTAAAKYQMIGQFSELFQQVYDCKKAYKKLMDSYEVILEIVGETVDIATPEQKSEVSKLAEKLSNAYTDGSFTLEEAQTNYLNSLSFCPKMENGIYGISTPLELFVFKAIVNSGETEADGELLNDIDTQNAEWGEIGKEDCYYAGVFDGHFHTILMNKVSTRDNCAIFGNLSGTVRNLIVGGSIQASHKFAAGVCAHLRGGNILNCQSSVNISSTVAGDGTHAGICAVTDGGGKITNCLFDGSISGSETIACAGIVSWVSVPTTIENCLQIGEITVSEEGSSTIGRNSGNILGGNNYYVRPFGSVDGLSTRVTVDQLACGEVCYKLNGGNETDPVWRQNLGEDDYPVLLPTHSIIVFQDGVYTAIEEVAEETSSTSVHGIYDLLGRRVSKPQKGLYIVNGKKCLYNE